MFPEISLHILDIVQNSIEAGADLIEIGIAVHTDSNRIQVWVSDNGCGMSKEQQLACENPYFTSRTTRKVGLGIPFFKQSAECTGGTFSILSQEGLGTRITAEYHMDHIDCIPIGNISATVYSIVIMNKTRDFLFHYQVDERQFVLNTREIKNIFGDGFLNSSESAFFIKEFLEENKKEADLGNIF